MKDDTLQHKIVTIPLLLLFAGIVLPYLLPYYEIWGSILPSVQGYKFLSLLSRSLFGVIILLLPYWVLQKFILNYSSLSGSIKFYGSAPSINPSGDGLIIALTLLNEGGKSLVWRKLNSYIKKGKNKTILTAKLIPPHMVINGVSLFKNDILKQFVFHPETPINGYILLAAPFGSLSKYKKSQFDLYLEFELESGKTEKIILPVQGTTSVQSGENYPTHGVNF